MSAQKILDRDYEPLDITKSEMPARKMLRLYIALLRKAKHKLGWLFDETVETELLDRMVELDFDMRVSDDQHPCVYADRVSRDGKHETRR